jgi:hypothetical protein
MCKCSAHRQIDVLDDDVVADMLTQLLVTLLLAAADSALAQVVQTSRHRAVRRS